MEYLTANNIIFALLSAVILICALLSVTTNKLLRAAIYLFFALIGIAGLYLQLVNFLQPSGAVGLPAASSFLFVFAIFLVHVSARTAKGESEKKQ